MEPGHTGNPLGRNGRLDVTPKKVLAALEAECQKKGISFLQHLAVRSIKNDKVLIAVLRKLVPDLTESDLLRDVAGGLQITVISSFGADGQRARQVEIRKQSAAQALAADLVEVEAAPPVESIDLPPVESGPELLTAEDIIPPSQWQGAEDNRHGSRPPEGFYNSAVPSLVVDNDGVTTNHSSVDALS